MWQCCEGTKFKKIYNSYNRYMCKDTLPQSKWMNYQFAQCTVQTKINLMVLFSNLPSLEYRKARGDMLWLRWYELWLKLWKLYKDFKILKLFLIQAKSVNEPAGTSRHPYKLHKNLKTVFDDQYLMNTYIIRTFFFFIFNSYFNGTISHLAVALY